MVECKPEKLKTVVDSTFRHFISFRYLLLMDFEKCPKVRMKSSRYGLYGLGYSRAAVIRTKCKRICKNERLKDYFDIKTYRAPNVKLRC
jgi:hypothetical protein